MAPGIGLMPGIPAHIHVDLQFPLYAEMGVSPFAVPFKLTLYHVNGEIYRIEGMRLKSWALDNGAKLPLKGDVNGVVTYTGTATFDPTWSSTTPKHGWYPYELRAITRFTNGDQTHNTIRLSVFSVIDTTQPEAPRGDGTGLWVQSKGNQFDATSPMLDRWQSNLIYFSEALPILGPVSPEMPWRVQAVAYNYSPPLSLLPPGITEVHVDPDLHNLVPGTLIASASGFKVSKSIYPPVDIPDGLHKVKFAWRRPNFVGDKELTSILVLPITVGLGGAAQQTGLTWNTETGAVSPPPPPPPSSNKLLTLVASKTTVAVGEPYTLTVTTRDAHVVKLDGVYPFMTLATMTCDGDPTLAATTCSKTIATSQPAAGSNVHMLTADGFSPVTVTITVTQ